MQKECKLFLDRNIPEKHKVANSSNGKFVIRNKDIIFDAKSFNKLLSDLHAILNSKNKRDRIIIDLGKTQFNDKLCYILLECLIYYLIAGMKENVAIRAVRINDNNIRTGGFVDSVLNKYLLNKKNVSLSNKIFVEEFEKFRYSRIHFRKIIKPLSESYNKNELSKLMSEVKIFFTSIYHDPDEKDLVKELSTVVTELVGNAWEHTQSHCLVDIDVSHRFNKKGKSKKHLYDSINIVILNFSNKLFWHGLKSKMMMADNTDLGNSERYTSLVKAYDNHKKFFNEDYEDENFYTVAALQNKISERLDDNESGGTGLTKLLVSLGKRTEEHMCYLFSGNLCTGFFPKHLEQSGEWIGFNEKNDFIAAVPDREIFCRSETYMPGTAYNLIFIIERSGE